MAKNSVVQRELKRTKLVARYAQKRKSLKATIKSTETSMEEKMAAVDSLQKLPRDSSEVRQRNRCRVAFIIFLAIGAGNTIAIQEAQKARVTEPDVQGSSVAVIVCLGPAKQCTKSIAGLIQD